MLLDVLEIAVIVVAARLFGKVAQRLGQPALIGEVVAGLRWDPACSACYRVARIFASFPAS
ncbi:hypothetical protein I547_7262 [Mycobacterium kansasii 824]|nr:hypothetical protein I547_7262 [Mycobacterium kansasii 824]